MAYEINRRPHVREELTVRDGDKEMTVSVDIDVHQIMTRYTGAVQKIKEAEDELKKLKADGGLNTDNMGLAYAALGKAVLNLFVLLFGDDQTTRIVDFYDGNHAEMLADFVPFLQDVIVPAIRDSQKQIAGRYSAKKWAK